MAAANDLEEISNYLHTNHSAFARETIQRIYSAAISLKHFPEKGRLGKISNTRELVLTPLPYLIVYAVEEESVQVFRILHGARDRV